MPPARPNRRLPASISANKRLKIWYGLLIAVLVIFTARLFYLQIIRHDYYQNKAQAAQLKEYEIPAERGTIKAYENGNTVPLVLNQTMYTLYADPVYIKDVDAAAAKIAAITKAKAADYAKIMHTPGTRYAVLAKRVSQQQKDQISALKLPGIGLQPQDYRVYAQGTLASQLLGFVNDDGDGKYGVEQALNKALSGSPGRLKAVTDAAGVPLAASKDNVEIAPKDGSDVVLTIDIGMQKQLEGLLKAGLDRAASKSGSALVIDPYSGAVKAMANWPTYDPSQFFKVKDPSVFNNASVSSPLEVGSTMKPLTAAAAIDQGVISANSTYNDPSRWHLDGHDVTNIEEDGGPGTHSIAQILDLSINTGATWMLMQMGGQTGTVNQKARDRWHDYMVNHYNFGKITGIEQGYEAPGQVPDPDKGFGLQLTYANTSFGQAMTATPLQMAAALSSVINGGKYYQPRLVDKVVLPDGRTETKQPKVVNDHVVAPKVSQDMRKLMDYVVKQHYLNGFSYLNFPDSYEVGGKTGTAEIASPDGGYYADKYNGTYIGFVGGDKPQYVIVVRVNEPGIYGYAGSQAAQPIFADIAHMLINNFNVVPKSSH
ncbi:MAG TPA: penicillin-binding protein 2 [Candidatus Saccharimonadales bacterium]|nr:penicillin-binding protein 2 [Candidatus Saccharimonadales bacterium]